MYSNDKEQSTVKHHTDESCKRREDVLYVSVYIKFKMGKQIYKDSNQNNLFWGGIMTMTCGKAGNFYISIWTVVTIG